MVFLHIRRQTMSYLTFLGRVFIYYGTVVLTLVVLLLFTLIVENLCRNLSFLYSSHFCFALYYLLNV